VQGASTNGRKEVPEAFNRRRGKAYVEQRLNTRKCGKVKKQIQSKGQEKVCT
jgi:hypothetical protein